MLGLAVADALGSPFEGLDAYGIYTAFGFARRIVEHPPVDVLTYTDDTQMMIGVAEALVEDWRIVEESLMWAFARNFDRARGYGPNTRQVVEAARDGRDWRALSLELLPDGSLGNGAAMRAAPVGLLFRDDPDRVWSEAALSALPTHRHPIGIEGAQLVALAVAIATRGGPFDRSAFFGELLGRARTDEFRWQLDTAAAMAPDAAASQFGSSIRADRSVVTAIACFAAEPHSYEETVARAIGLGDDTDTVAAMAGAISGAYLSIAAVPPRLLDMLEDGDKGRAYIETLATRLEATSHRPGNLSPGSAEK